MFVDVGVEVKAWVGVLVGLALPLPTWITNCGAFAPPSLLTKLIAVLFFPMSAKLYFPFPVISKVTSTLVHTPPLNEPMEPTWFPSAGALLYVIVVSPQLVSGTPYT